MHLYGTSAAADGCHCAYSGLLEELGFVKGDASACTFRHTIKDIVCSVHGDDFTSSGPKASLDWTKASMDIDNTSYYEPKIVGAEFVGGIDQ